MGILHKVTEIFGLNDETWIQHSNPRSVWTRMIILPFIALAVWSRVLIGWYSLVIVIALFFWTWINPRFFGKPKSTKHWSSKAVLGERVWLKNKENPLAPHHLKAILILNIVTGSGLPFLIWGLYSFNLFAVLLGLVLVVLGKMWFLDRMVWIYEDMKNRYEEYLSWEY
jgi:hypothetical protein